MISLELSMVQHNLRESARLAAATEEFLIRGGHIQEAEPFGYVPRPVLYGSYATPGKAVERVKPEPAPKQTLRREVRDFEKARAESQEKIALVARLRLMAETMTQKEAAAATGISARKVSRLGEAYGIAFMPAANAGHKNMIPHQKDLVADARNVERIKAMRDLGINRRQASRRMGISSTLMRRLIKDYEIDYPVSKRAKQ